MDNPLQHATIDTSKYPKKVNGSNKNHPKVLAVFSNSIYKFFRIAFSRLEQEISKKLVG